MPSYEHTQHGPIWLILMLPVTGAVVAAGFAEEAAMRSAMMVVAAIFALLAACFTTLTVRDCDDYLDVRFGPLPWFGTKLRYDAVEHVEATRSRLIDGWGIHWIPGRGWTFNLWGFDCVELDMAGGKTARIGTDDVEGLLTHLTSRASKG